MRVGFGDEDGDRLFGHGAEDITAFYQHMVQVMQQGKPIRSQSSLLLLSVTPMLAEVSVR